LIPFSIFCAWPARWLEACQGCAGEAPSTALFAANDLAAIGVLTSVLGAGFQVAGDIAVVGYDDMPFAASKTLSLTMH
jgi:DNA-binding LacI/PurR family transcriptional regulator